MKFVEHRGKIIAYQIALGLVGVKVSIDFYMINRPNQFLYYKIDDGEEKKEKVWNMTAILYDLLYHKTNELKEKAWMYDDLNR
jgi:hypothetical protein